MLWHQRLAFQYVDLGRCSINNLYLVIVNITNQRTCFLYTRTSTTGAWLWILSRSLLLDWGPFYVYSFTSSSLRTLNLHLTCILVIPNSFTSYFLFIWCIYLFKPILPRHTSAEAHPRLTAICLLHEIKGIFHTIWCSFNNFPLSFLQVCDNMMGEFTFVCKYLDSFPPSVSHLRSEDTFLSVNSE